MEKQHYSIVIKAPKETVWHAMLDDVTYREWTEAFSKGSYYEGNWNTGSKILFLAPGEKGLVGMVSRIRQNRPYEFISIEHLGHVADGKEDTTSELAKRWSGALENYTFRETAGSTEVLVDIDVTDEYKDMFQKMWPEALKKLKQIAEKL